MQVLAEVATMSSRSCSNYNRLLSQQSSARQSREQTSAESKLKITRKKRSNSKTENHTMKHSTHAALDGENNIIRAQMISSPHDENSSAKLHFLFQRDQLVQKWGWLSPRQCLASPLSFSPSPSSSSHLMT